MRLYLFLVLLLPALTMFAFAQEEEHVSSVTVMTDKQAYDQGDIIVITGKVTDRLSDVPVTVRVIAPNGNMVRIDQIEVGMDKTFRTEMTAGGDLMSKDGLYRVVVLYGFTVGFSDRDVQTTEKQEKFDKVNTFTSNEAEATFMFGGSGALSNPTPESVDRGYTITGGEITNIGSNLEKKSMVISIATTGDGELSIKLLRSLINAVTEDGQDVSFIVLVDGVPTEFEEMKTSADRTLSIPFRSGAQTIEIIGTFVIPEFGPMAIILLAGIMAPTLLVLRRMEKNHG